MISKLVFAASGSDGQIPTRMMCFPFLLPTPTAIPIEHAARRDCSPVSSASITDIFTEHVGGLCAEWRMVSRDPRIPLFSFGRIQPYSTADWVAELL